LRGWHKNKGNKFIVMQKREQGANQTLPVEANPESSPRRAATKLKEMQQHLEMMRNRFKVIEGHDRYHRYRTIDQSRRIEHHDNIHECISQERQALKQSMEKMQETSEVKEKNDQLRLEIKHRIQEARKNLLEDRLERSQRVSQEFHKNEQKIREIKQT
jgi:hypothetical protein